MSVVRIMPENIMPLWDQLSALIGPAVAMTSTHTLEDVRRGLMTMRAQLWARMDGHRVLAAATTYFVDHPVGLFLCVWHAGAVRGEKMRDDEFFDVLDHWRAVNNCIGFEVYGRQGWMRRFPQARVEGLILRMVSP